MRNPSSVPASNPEQVVVTSLYGLLLVGGLLSGLTSGRWFDVLLVWVNALVTLLVFWIFAPKRTAMWIGPQDGEVQKS